jgi:protein-glutamine gamma-glutamyltransferase
MPLSPIPQTDVLLDERLRLEQPLLGAVWLGIASIALIEQTVFYLLAGTFAILANLLAIRRRKEIYVRRWFVNTALGLATCILVVESLFVGLGLITALGHYLILIQICKLFERSRNRDYVQLLALSGLVMVSAALQCDALWFAGVLLVYLVLACHTAMVFTLKRGLDAATRASLPGESEPMAPRRVAWNAIRHWPVRPLRNHVVTLFGAIALAGVIVFVVAPRGPATTAHRLGGARSRASTGMGEGVRLGDAKRIYASDRVVMRLSGEGVLPGSYLRGRAFYRYTDSEWSVTVRPWSAQPLRNPGARVLADARVLTISMESELLPTLYAPPGTLHVDCEEGPVLAEPGGLSLHALGRTRGPVRYRAQVSARSNTTSQSRYITMFRLQTASELLSLWREEVQAHPRVVRLAREWVSDLLRRRNRDLLNRPVWDLRIARRLAERLRQRCTYSLDLLDVDPNRDGVEDFLFHTRKGHCEYFASAHVVMCRALGVPARLATGFRIGLSTPGVEGYLVRDRDAHAWTEVFSPATGWVIVDATGSAPGMSSADRWASARGFWESAKFAWYEHVVGYDSVARARLVTRAGALVSASWDFTRKTATALGRGFMNLLLHGYVDSALRRLAVVIACLALIVEGLLLGRMLRRHFRARAALAAGLPGSPTEVRFMKRLLSLARRHGAPLRPEWTLHRWAREAAERMQQPTESIDRLVGLYNRARWGRDALDPDEIRLAEERVRQLRRTLAQARSGSSAPAVVPLGDASPDRRP